MEKLFIKLLIASPPLFSSVEGAFHNPEPIAKLPIRVELTLIKA